MRVTERENPRSLAASARRAQIIAATMAVIAEDGFANASFARIARRAGLSSTRLISYHFAGKDDLVQAVVADVFAEIGQFMADRVGSQPDAPARLRAYIEGNVEFISTHRPQMMSLLEIVLAGHLPAGAAEDRTGESYLETILRDGQAAGQFREFDPRVIAIAVQRAVEGLPFLLHANPDLDTSGYARELVTLFDLGTRRGPA